MLLCMLLCIHFNYLWLNVLGCPDVDMDILYFHFHLKNQFLVVVQETCCLHACIHLCVCVCVCVCVCTYLSGTIYHTADVCSSLYVVYAEAYRCERLPRNGY